MNRLIIYLGFVLLVLNSCHHEDNSEHNRTLEIYEGLYVKELYNFWDGSWRWQYVKITPKEHAETLAKYWEGQGQLDS